MTDTKSSYRTSAQGKGSSRVSSQTASGVSLRDRELTLKPLLSVGFTYFVYLLGVGWPGELKDGKGGPKMTSAALSLRLACEECDDKG